MTQPAARLTENTVFTVRGCMCVVGTEFRLILTWSPSALAAALNTLGLNIQGPGPVICALHSSSCGSSDIFTIAKTYYLLKFLTSSNCSKFEFLSQTQLEATQQCTGAEWMCFIDIILQSLRSLLLGTLWKLREIWTHSLYVYLSAGSVYSILNT